MQKQKLNFIGLRDYIRFNHPDMVEEFDKTISSLTNGTEGAISHKNNLREVINDYLARISGNEKLFNIVQRWKYEVLTKARRFIDNDVYWPAEV